MAGSLIGALRVTLGIDTAAFEQGLGIAQKRLNAVGKNMQNLGDRMTGIGSKLTLGVTAPLTAMGAASTKAFNDFEASMSNVATLVDTTTESMQDMGKAVLGISKRVPVAASDLTSALYDIRSAGIGAGDAMGVLENSAKLGVAGLGTTAEAVDLVTSSMNAFNLKGEDANKVYDLVFRTVKSGKTTISQLAQGFGAVAGTVAQAGIKIDDYLASVAALTTTGLPAAQAHTQLRAAISGLTRETKLSQEVFSKLGVKTFPELIKKSGGLGAAFAKLREATDGNDAKLLQLLGSTEAYNAVLSISGAQNKAYTDTLSRMRDGTEALGSAFDKQSQTTAAKAQIMRNKLNVAAVQIGQVVVPVLVKIGEFVGKVADSFSKLSPGVQSAVVAFGAVAAAIGPLLMVVGSIASGIGALVPVFAPVLALIGEAGLAGALGAMAAAAAPVVGVVAALAAGWALFGDKIGPVLSDLWTKVQSVLGPKLTALFDTVKATLTELWQGPFGQAIRVVIDVLGDLGAAYTAILGEALIRIISTLVTIVQNAFKIIGDVFRILGDLLTGDFSGAWNGVKQLVGDVVNGWIAVLNSLAPEAVKAVQALVTGVQDWIGKRLVAIWDDAKTKIEAVKGSFFDLYDAVVGHSYIPDMVDEIGANMRRLDELLVKPAEQATSKAKAAFRSLAQDTSDLMNRLFPERSQLNSATSDRDLLDRAKAAGLVDQATYDAGQQKLSGQIAQAQQDISPIAIGGGSTDLEATVKGLADLTNTLSAMPQILSNVQREFQWFGQDAGDRIMGGIADILTQRGDAWDVMKRAMLNLLNDVVVRSLQNLETSIFGEQGLGGALGNLFSGLFGRATGGPVLANTPYIVGEKRPELFVPSTSGRIVPNLNEMSRQSGSDGAPTSMNFNFYGPVTNPQEVRRSAAQASAQLLRLTTAGKRGV